MTREMGTLKSALDDYMNENFNHAKQASFLKQSQSAVGFSLPLKDKQIKVTKRDKVLIKQPEKKGKAEDNQTARGYYGMKKKANFMEYDLKSSKIVEMKKKRKKTYQSGSESESSED